VTALGICHPRGGVPYVITVSQDNFFTAYYLSNLEQLAHWHVGQHHKSRPANYCLVVEDSLYLIGSYLSAWKIRSGGGDNGSPHQAPIIWQATNDRCSTLVSVDRSGEVITWNLATGRKEGNYHRRVGHTEVLCAAVDGIHKRLILGYSDGAVRIMAVNTGVLLTEIDRRYFKGGCFHAAFTQLSSLAKILACSGNKSAVLFDDLSGNRVRFVRNFVCPIENPTLAISLKNRYVLTVGTGKELLIWTETHAVPIRKITFQGEPSAAVDLPNESDLFLLGDASGFVHLVSLKTGSIAQSINVFRMRIPSPITSLLFYPSLDTMVITNMHGYVRLWKQENGEFIEIKRFRAHTSSVVSTSISKKYLLLVTAGLDDQIRLWSFADGEFYIGEFGGTKSWDVQDPQTWVKGNGLEEDFLDFALDGLPKEEGQKKQASEEEDKAEARTVEVAEEVPVRRSSISEMRSLLEEMEEMLYGRTARSREASRHATHRTPVVKRNLSMEALAPNETLQAMAGTWTGTRTRASADLRSVLPRLTGTMADDEKSIPAASSPTLSYLAENTFFHGGSPI
jgi:WD40 repeat protein